MVFYNIKFFFQEWSMVSSGVQYPNIQYPGAQYPQRPNKFMPGNFNGAGSVPVDSSNPWKDFGFIDKDKLEKGAKKLSDKAEKATETSWALQLIKSQFGISDDPKKTFISAALTVATVVFLAWLGNSKLSVHKMTELGLNINDVLGKGGALSGVSNLFKQGKNFLTEGIKKITPKTCNNIAETFKNRPAKAKWNVMGYGSGIFGIFQNTPIAIIKSSLDKLSKDDAVLTLTKLVGNADVLDDSGKVLTSVADEFYNLILGNGQNAAGNRLTSKEICKQFVSAIAKNFNCIGAEGKIDKRALYNVLCALKKGEIDGLNVNEFTDVLMGGDIISSWAPANIFNIIGSGVSKLFGKEWKNVGRGNLGDSLIKYGISAGEFADNKLSSLVQKSLLFPTETMSNFVNDKSTFGLFLCGSMMNMYNDVQDAPKEKRAGTIVRNFLTSIASFVIATPFAYGATYKLATLGNLSKAKGETTIITKALKLVGNFFNMGLNKKSLIGGATGIMGGALRFYLIQSAFAGLILSPVDKFVTKIFGEPYNPEEEAVKEAQRLQNQGFVPSSILQNYLNNPNNHIGPGLNPMAPQVSYEQNDSNFEPKRTYIPSSKPFVSGQIQA